MKYKYITHTLAIFLLFCLNVNGQVLITKSDSISLENDTVVYLVVPNYRGNIKWQKSPDGINWNTVPGNAADTLFVKVDLESLYRAVVTDGTCLPVYSDSVGIFFTKPKVRTLPVNTVKQFSAELSGNLILDGGTDVTETGFFLSETPDSVVYGLKLVTPADADTFNYRLNYLKPNTKYYIQAYAKNSKGIAYGDTVSFTTNKYEYLIIDFTADTLLDWDARLIANDGSNYYVRFKNKKPVSVYFTPSGMSEGYSIFFGNDGLPSTMVVDTFIVIYDNYSDSLVDISVITPVEGIRIFRDIPINLTQLELKKMQSYEDNEWLKFAIQTTSNLIGVTTCSIGLLSGVATIPTLVGCGATVINMLYQVVPEDWEILGIPVGEAVKYLAGTAGGLAGIYGCKAGADIYPCITTLMKLLLSAEAKYINILADNKNVPVAQNMLKLITDSLTDIRDDNVYKTVKIGNQWWMAENLAYLPSVSPSSLGSATTPYYYVYDYQGTNVSAAKATTNYKSYGVLYNWSAAMSGAASSSTNPSKVQGVCPSGWHLPSDAEWKQLEIALGMTQFHADAYGTRGTNQGTQLKATRGWTSNGNGTNASGFYALPGGLRDFTFGTFEDIGYSGGWWSSTQYTSYSAWDRSLFYNYASVGRNGLSLNISSGFSVRCVRNENHEASLPTVTTTDITSITQISATGGGNVTDDGGETVTERGICWNTSQNPTTANSKTSDGTGTGSFTSTLTALSVNTKYYVRAYATNSAGTAYGNQIEFTTSSPVYGSFTDSRDNKAYKTVKIGDQTWMAENLAYIPSVSPSSQGSLTAMYYYVYDYQGTDVTAAKQHINYNTYGVLYNWPAAMAGAASSSTNPSKVQGVCPSGWHLPSDAEWKQLEMALGMTQFHADAYGTRGTNQGTQLKATNGWASSGNGTNASGFSALPGGLRDFTFGTFEDIGYSGGWWSSTQYTSYSAWDRSLFYNYASVGRNSLSLNISSGFSVRCVRD